MKSFLLAALASALASQAANLQPLDPAEELAFPAQGEQYAMIVNDDQHWLCTFIAAGWNGVVVFQGKKYDTSLKRWVEQWDSKARTEIGFTSGIMGLARSETLFMAVGNAKNPTTYQEDAPRCAISKDGSTWTTHAGTTPGWMMSLAHGDGTWVATGSQSTGAGGRVGQIQYSKDDGATWNVVTLGDGETLLRAFWNGSLWVAVGAKRTSEMGGTFMETRVYTSPDGATWTMRPTPGSVTLNSVVWGHGKWVAVGTSSPYRGTHFPIILNSVDAITWTDVSPQDDEAGSLTDIDTTQLGYVAVGRNRVIHSYDGVHWEPVYTAPQANLKAVRTTPFGREGSRLYLLADTGRAFQDTLIEKAEFSSLRGAGRVSTPQGKRSADPLSVQRFADPRNQGRSLDSRGRRLVGSTDRL
ncbi:MAG TPA: sialidase family protein [Fibrobacteria bacterium]|nr:sialidase family protein [Fibrobacteria bacterium]HOX53091.1 sialidase family protein [Fibrobacteria bacterium]